MEVVSRLMGDICVIARFMDGMAPKTLIEDARTNSGAAPSDDDS